VPASPPPALPPRPGPVYATPPPSHGAPGRTSFDGSRAAAHGFSPPQSWEAKLGDLAARAGSDDDDDRSVADSSVYLDAADEDEERMGLVSGWSGPASTSGPSSHGSNASSTVWGSERDRQFSGKLLQSVETFRAAAEAEAAEASARGGTYGAPPRGQLPPLRVDEALASASRRLRGLGEDTTTRRYRGYDGSSLEGRRVVAAASALAAALRAPCCATRVEEQGNVILSVVVGRGGRPASDALREAALEAGAPAAWGRHVDTGLHVCCDVS
jgi:hypothetical protein